MTQQKKHTGKRRKRRIPVLLLASMLTGMVPAYAGAEPAGLQRPALVMTEIHPDVSGADDFEFFELYNASDVPVHLSQYSFIYRYTDGSKPDVPMLLPDAVVEPGKLLVVWNNNNTAAPKTAADFNKKYGTSLGSGELIELKGFDGFYNSGNRAIVIRDGQGAEIAGGTYFKEEIGAGLGVHYSLEMTPDGQAKYAVKGAPSPGRAEPGQLDSPPAGGEYTNLPPEITHTAVPAAASGQALAVKAFIRNPDANVTGSVYGSETVTAAVYYRADAAGAYAWTGMNGAAGGEYTAEIPAAALGGASLQYYIEARDSQHTVNTDTYTVNVQRPDGGEYDRLPRMMITELVPDTANIAGADAYEFVEIYNNTDKPRKLSDYTLAYRNNGSDAQWPVTGAPADAVIPPQSAAALWVMNGKNNALTAADFNANFQTSLTENVNLFRVEGGGGLSNAGPRSLVLKDAGGKEVSIASYQNDDQTKPDKGVFYRYAPSGATEMELLDGTGTVPATPGTVDVSQVPPVPVTAPDQADLPPEITHDPAVSADARNDLKLAAVIKDELPTVTAAVYYRNAGETDFRKLPMEAGAGEVYSASIPKAELTTALLEYRIEAADQAGNKKSTPVYSVSVKLPGADDAKAPQLLVTELVPDSANVGGADGYEFIEIYNNSDRDINLKDYKLMYRYTSSGPDADVVWPTDREDILIASGQTLVFWVINAENTHSTVADFNANYSTQLVENKDIFRVYSGGMANGGDRGILIATNTRKEISVASYDNNEETQPDKGIFYKAPTDGTTAMIKYSAGLLPATPGTVDPAQIPATRVPAPDDKQAPTLSNLSPAAIDQSKDVELLADAKDDIGVKTVALYYRNDRQTEFTKRYLAESYDDGLYHHKLYSPELIGKSYIEYYYAVSDGTNETVSEKRKLTITGGRDTSALRLNVEAGAVLTGETLLKGTAEQGSPGELALKLDGEALTDTFTSLENDAYFAFDVTGVNYYFKNGVTIGDEILYTFQDPINQYTTLTVPMQADRLREGDNVISIRAGSKTSPFDDRPEENKDDFTIRNVRLVLADGTEIYDPKFSDREKELQMGDSAGKHEFLDFSFNLPKEKLSSLTYKLDTRKLADGKHTVAVEQAGRTASAEIQVDNTAPVIEPSVESGREYRGGILIDAKVTDAIAGLAELTAKLDGESVTLPHQTASYELKSGEHRVEFTAVDRAGNKSQREVVFTVPDELPLAPERVAPDDRQTGLGSEAGLRVKVADPTGDALTTTFYRGFKADATRPETLGAYRGASDTEPPKSLVPGGESSFGAEDYKLIAAKDGQYLTDDSVEQFPYQRFEVKLDESVKDTDRVEISWSGASLEGRKVSLYAWSPAAQAWKPLDEIIAGTEDFELGASVTAGEYRDGNVIHVMVQDEIAPQPAAAGPKPREDYDYSFAWISDTQYYAESYPYIFEDIVNWIADNKEAMNIKYVFHTGDIVDEADKPYQWDVANKNMKVLEDANIPYGVLAGNHDVLSQYGDYSYYWDHYGEARFKDKPYYGESYKNNMGHYDLISASGNDYIMIYMGWGLADEEIDWMNAVLKKHPNRKAIINMHEYLLVSGNRAPIADQVFEKVIVPNKNVIAALSGHYHDSELLVSGIDDNGDGVNDRNVYQMLADYQGAPEGGLGYIRLLKVDAANNKIYVETYSPYLDDYNFYEPAEHPGKDEFVIDLDLQPETKRVSTDYFGVNVYTDARIGEPVNTESGAEASQVWTGLQPDTEYEWYAAAEDEFGGRTVSEVWAFTTGDFEPGTEPTPTPTPTPSPSPSSGPVPSDGATPTPAPTAEPSERPSQAPGQSVPGGFGGAGQASAAPSAPAAAAAPGAVTAAADGAAYRVDGAQLVAAAERAAAGAAVEVRVPVPQGEAAYELHLAGEGLRALASRGSAVRIAAGGAEITLPAAVLEQAGAAGEAVLTFRAGADAARKAAAAAAQGSSALTDRGIVYTMTLELRTGGQTERLTVFREPVTVNVAFTPQQAAAVNADYAGVYRLNGSNAEYLGGSFRPDGVSFRTAGFSDFAVLEYRKSFKDLAGHWAEESVRKLAAKHVATGVSDDRFAPNASLTRADFAVLAVKLLEPGRSADGTAAFSDVLANAYYAGYVARAAELGLVSGYNGSYRPLDPVSREEAAVILMKLREQPAGNPASGTASGSGAAAVPFTDMKDVSGWAADAVSAAKKAGLINGLGGGKFMPKKPVTRAEAAVMLAKMLD